MDVNWRWHTRLRGVLPVSPEALSDDGRLVLVRLDELEVRKYQILHSDSNGGMAGAGSVTVETVRQMHVTADAPMMIGVTDDDLYLFREGKKSRFHPERRVAYLSVGLARSGSYFVAAFTDMMFAGQTLALATTDTGGKLLWSKDMDAPINVVAIAPDGRRVAAGLETGLLLAFDAGRSLLWEAALEGPAIAAGFTSGGTRCVVITAAGRAMALDDGDVAWSADLSIGDALEPGSVTLACDLRGAIVAVAGGSDSEGWITLLDAEGRTVWEHATESRVTGAALSPSGSLLALTQADGEVLRFEVEAGKGIGGIRGLGPDEEFRRAMAARDAGKTQEARQALLRVLAADPGQLKACDALTALDEAARALALGVAEDLVTEARFGEAIAALDAVRVIFPADVELPRRWSQTVEAAEIHAADGATSAEDSGELINAVECWLSLLQLDPKRRRAREEVARLNRLLADQWAREGEAALAAGREDEAVATWQRAQAAAPSEALAARLREIELQRCLRAGLSLYGQQRFPEAAFQFRKVLALQPDHPEALRHLAYISSAGPQSSLSERFSRLE